MVDQHCLFDGWGTPCCTSWECSDEIKEEKNKRKIMAMTNRVDDKEYICFCAFPLTAPLFLCLMRIF